MIAVKLWGGLGNQMFLYAFAKHLEVLRGEKVYFYTIPWENNPRFDIMNFNVKIEFIQNDIINKHSILPNKGYCYRLERKLTQKFRFINPEIYVEDSLYFKPQIPTKAKFFDGYFQSFRYFSGLTEMVRKEFQPNEITLNNLYVMPEGINKPNSVSVHIRRGDYLDKANKKIFAPCTYEYYQRAVNEVAKKISDPEFYIFSNNVEWIRNNPGIFIGLNYHIIDNSNINNSSIADFIFMSHCSHNIMANSTFSWWAAWLNNNPHKTVIAPQHWYNGKLNKTTIDLIPETWLRV